MTNKEKLNQLRARHNLTIDDIAVLCSVSVDTVKTWLYRENNIPNYVTRLIELEMRAKQ